MLVTLRFQSQSFEHVNTFSISINKDLLWARKYRYVENEGKRQNHIKNIDENHPILPIDPF